MISPLEKRFINIFLFSNILRLCYGEGNNGFYEFGEVELYSEVKHLENYEIDVDGIHILQGYSKKVDYSNLCIKAKEYASLDGLYCHYKRYNSQALKFYRPNKPSITTYVQKCDTIPISYLRFDWKDQNLKVMIPLNPFEDEQFTIVVENIKSIPIPRPDMLKTPLPELWKQRMYDDFTNAARLQICMAARKQIQKTFDGVKIKMLDTEPAKTAIFTIESLDGMKRNRIVIPCPSYPQIYVHFENNFHHMVAVFVENQPKLEDIEVPSTQKDTPSGLPMQGLEDFKREYKFEVQPTKKVCGCGETSLFLRFSCNPGYEFNKFFVEELNTLCIAAKEFASLDGLTTADIYEKKKFEISYPQLPESWERMCVIAVKCNTIPTSYLRLGESVNDIKIAIESNSFVEDKDITYEVEEVKSHPKPVQVVSPKRFGILGFERDSKKDRERKRKSISQLTGSTERLNICLAARKTVREKKLGEPVMQTSEVNESQELEFELSKGSQTEAAIECPSIPVMFVYYDNSPKNVKIILVKNHRSNALRLGH